MVANASLPSIESFEAKGWFLSQEGIELIASENPGVNSLDDFIAAAKDMDLRSISTKGWNKTGDKVGHLPTPLVLQLLEVRNTAMPSTNQVEKPRLLSATFTDGKKKYKGAEVLGRVDSLKLHTPPGTKFFVKKPIEIQDQVLILGPGMLDDMGGHVQELVQAWRAGKQFLKRFGGKSITGQQDEQEGPPAFVPFKVKTHSRSTDRFKKSNKHEEKVNGQHDIDKNNKKVTKSHQKEKKTEAPFDQSNEREASPLTTEKKPQVKKEKKTITKQKQPITDTTSKSEETLINGEKQAPKTEKRKKREKGSQKKENGLDLREKKTIRQQKDMPASPSEERSQAASVHNVPTHPVPHEQKEKRTKTKNKKGSRKEEKDSSEQQQQQQQEDINHSRDLAKSNAKPTRSRNNERISVDSKPANTIQEKNKTAVNVTGDSLLATDTLEETSSLEKPAKSTNKRKGRNRNKKKAGQETVQEEVTSVEEKQATEAPTKSQDTPSLQTEPPTQAKTRNNKRGKHQKKTEQNTDEQPTGLAEPALEKKPPKVEERTRRPSGQPEESKEVIKSIPKDEEVTHKRQPRKPRQRSKKTKEVKEVEPKLPQTSVEQEVQKPSSISLPPPTPPSHPAAQVNSTTPVAHAITTSSSMNNNSTTPSDDVSVDRTPQEQPVYNGHRNSNPYLSRPMEPYYNNDLHQSMATSTPAHHPIPQHEYYYQHPQPVYPMIDYSMMMPYDYTTGMPAGMYNYPPAPLPPLVPSQQPSQPVQPQQTQPYMQPMYYIPDMASQRQQSPSYYNHQMHYTQLYDDAGYRDYNSRGRGRGMTTSNGRGRGRSEPK